MKTNKTVLTSSLFLLGCFFLQAQTPKYCLLNRDTVTYHGTTDTLDYMPVQVNTDGNIIISGNQKMSATQYDATTAAQLSDASLAWTNSYNTSNLKYFITASTHDGSGNIYNVGAARNATTSTSFDFFTQKLNSSGTVIWTQYYNGPNNSIDVASAVTVDGSGNVYVTGASEGTLSLLDYCTIKYSNTGTTQWTSRYNYSGAMDVPTKLSLVGSDVVVSGSSGSSFVNYDFATVKYNVTSGVQTYTSRTSNPNAAAQDQVCSMTTDGDGNVYVAGTTLNGGNYNVQLQKLDTALNVVWTQTYNATGFDDAGINLVLDNIGNVYVTGSACSNSNCNLKQLLVLKYSPSGVFRWAKLPCSLLSGNSVGMRIRIKTDNEVIVGGNIDFGNNQDLVLMAMDSTGKLMAHETYDGPAQGTEKFMDLTAEGDFIYVTARSFNGSDDDNIVIKYRMKTTTPALFTDSQGFDYDPNMVIVHFNKKALKMNRINDKKRLFGKLSEFVADSTCDKITNLLDPYDHYDINARNFNVEKIFHDFTESDTVTMSRLGDYVRVHDYYTHLVVFIPSSISNTVASNQLKTLKPDVHRTELNYYLFPTTNDPSYATGQAALHPTGSYPNGHVNWDSTNYIASGESFVKVGVYDTGIDFSNPDYTGMTQQGKDFVQNLPFTVQNNDDSDHGTGISGIIAAVKNNNTGIAGIAGRDNANPNNQGISLYDCKVCSNAICSIQFLEAGLLKGILSTQNNGYGLHVINMSIRLAYNFFNYFPDSWGGGVVQLFNDANRLGVALVGPKGNQNLPSYIFPADYNDRSLMTVGSSGEDGHHCLLGTNCSNMSTTWGNIDFEAPGTMNLVTTLDNLGGFKQEDGTSIASPHVAGASALMMSYFNSSTPNWNNMDHEDCEHILERTCTDLADSITYDEGLGYDTISGWGRINITKALKVINKNYYRFRHITTTVGNTSFVKNTSTIATNKSMTYDEASGVPSGNYSTDIYEVTTTLNYNLLPTESILSYWPMYKECYGAIYDTSKVETDRPNFSTIVSVSNTQAVLKTYYYRNNVSTTYYPFNVAGTHQSAITLYTYDSSGSVGIPSQDRPELNGNFKIFPNPNNGDFTLYFESDKAGILDYKVFDILGKCVKSAKINSDLGENEVKINISQTPAGIYNLTIFDSKGVAFSKKVVKQ